MEENAIHLQEGQRALTDENRGFSLQLHDVDAEFPERSAAYSGVPNLISTFGYINASWTLRADINSSYACRLLNHMRKTGTKKATPKLRESDMGMPQRDWIEGFSSGYMKRSMSEMPKQGDREPWLNTQDFYKDKKMLSRNTSLEDGVMEFV